MYGLHNIQLEGIPKDVNKENSINKKIFIFLLLINQ